MNVWNPKLFDEKCSEKRTKMQYWQGFHEGGVIEYQKFRFKAEIHKI